MGIDVCHPKFELAAKSSPARLPVKRCLFGDIDKIDTVAILKRQTQQHLEEQSKKWNFDFVNEVPLDGEFTWEKIEVITDSPTSAAAAAITESPRKPNAPKISLTVTGGRVLKKRAVRTATGTVDPNAKCIQKCITDYMAKAK